ncbi:MAG: DNA recombination protein RmuC [Candidatus Omnitrophica bacterium]|nr:DNA recombination protein RmuC [Candidatus Omnitrophota bacterium]MBU4141245.1 DNA recombination protein RmuC [Candidatus Omnitrophota bacterium]
MNPSIIFLIASAVLAIAVWGIVFLIKAIKHTPRSLSPEELIKVLADVGALKATLQSVEGGQRDLSSNIKETQRIVDSIKTGYDSRKLFFEQLRDSVERMKETISGTKRRGEAGENILHDILKSFPPSMVARNFRIAGKEVEFALILSNDKVVPIDSKWVAQELIRQFAQEKNETQRLSLANKIEHEISRRVGEIAQYIDPARTVPWAVAAIPDAAFSVCRKAHLDAYKKGVIIIPYYLVLPYLLTLFNLHLQYAGSIDVENLQHYIIDIKRHLGEMEATLENNIVRAVKMISNAANEYRQTMGSIRGSLNNLQTGGAREQGRAQNEKT